MQLHRPSSTEDFVDAEVVQSVQAKGAQGSAARISTVALSRRI